MHESHGAVVGMPEALNSRVPRVNARIRCTTARLSMNPPICFDLPGYDTQGGPEHAAKHPAAGA